MKKVFILIPFVLFAMVSKSLAQKKDSVTLLLDYFDPKTGNQYGFTKKFDHMPTSIDSIIFRRVCSIQMHKITDSLRKLEAPNKKISTKRKKNKPAHAIFLPKPKSALTHA